MTKIRILALSIFVLSLTLNVSKSFAIGHYASDGKCYGYFFNYWNEDYPATARIWAYGIRTDLPYAFHMINNRILKSNMQIRLSYYVYWWNVDHWVYVTYIAGAYTIPSLVDEILETLEPYGVPLGVWPQTYAPNGCTTPCQDAEQRLKDTCGEGNYYFESDRCEGCCKSQANLFEKCLSPSGQRGGDPSCN